MFHYHSSSVKAPSATSQFGQEIWFSQHENIAGPIPENLPLQDPMVESFQAFKTKINLNDASLFLVH